MKGVFLIGGLIVGGIIIIYKMISKNKTVVAAPARQFQYYGVRQPIRSAYAWSSHAKVGSPWHGGY